MALGMEFVVKIGLGTGIWENLGWEMGFGTALQDPHRRLLWYRRGLSWYPGKLLLRVVFLME